MDAILTAGGVPGPVSPLYPYTNGMPKAALQIGGKPMIQWVLDALEASPSIKGIVIVGVEEMQDELQSSKILKICPAGGDMIGNFLRGAEALLEQRPSSEEVALISSDIPLLTPESVEWVIKASQATDEDLYYSVIEQDRMEERYPESARSYVKLKGISLCGGDLSVLKLGLYKDRADLWQKIFDARKSVFRQARLIGFDLLLQLLLRSVTLEDAVRKVTKRLDITGQALICPYPEIGMDVDRPHQLEIARKELS